MLARAAPRIAAALLAAAVLSGVTAHAAEAVMTPPRAGVTTQDAMTAFVGALLGGCLASREAGGGLADLPSSARAHFQAAAAIDRKWSRATSEATLVWTTPELGGTLTVDEPSAGRCEVVAIGLPVEPTFQGALAVARRLHPDFADVAVPKGYNPIAHQLDRTAAGVTYTLHMEGSEPGGLAHPGRMLAGHASRFSLLTAWVTREPVSAAKPAG